MRATCRYLLRAVIGGLPALRTDILGGVILAAIDDANIGHLDADRLLAQRYAGYGAPPPDGYRRPVPIRSIANRLHLPYETARHRIEDLVAAGLCRRAKQGVYVPAAIDPRHQASAQSNYVAVRTLLRDLQTLAPDIGWPMAPRFEATASDPPLRLVFRRSTAFGVDALAGFAKVAGGYNAALVYLAAVEATGRSGGNGATSVVRTSMLARSLDLPISSVRRRLLFLASEGLITPARFGYAAHPAPPVAAQVGQLARENLQRLHSFFAELASLDVPLGL